MSGSQFHDSPERRAAREARRGLTAAELDAMDVGAIVVDRDGEEWQKNSNGNWFTDTAWCWAGRLIESVGPIRRRETHVEQPMPTPSTGPSMHDLALDVLAERKQIGLARYGEPLQAMNGRDAVRDTIEELADGLVYALQIREERRLLRAELVELAREEPESYGALGDIIARYFPAEES